MILTSTMLPVTVESSSMVVAASLSWLLARVLKGYGTILTIMYTNAPSAHHSTLLDSGHSREIVLKSRVRNVIFLTDRLTVSMLLQLVAMAH